MIFLTVGSQLAFDRLTQKIDEWAGKQNGLDIYAQIGITNYIPMNMKYSAQLDPEEYLDKIKSADILISHAGMGTIITALEYNKPLLIMPRKAALNETRNDHQVPTARHFSNYNLIQAANDEREITESLELLLDLTNQGGIRDKLSLMSPELINGIQEFIYK